MLTGDLAAAVGGFRWEAIETELEDNLSELSRAWAAHIGAAGASPFESWDDALRTVLSGDGEPHLVVLDEIQRVIGKSPTFPSLVQRIIGPPGLGDRTAHTRLLLCGSAFGEMRRLIDGSARCVSGPCSIPSSIPSTIGLRLPTGGSQRTRRRRAGSIPFSAELLRTRRLRALTIRQKATSMVGSVVDCCGSSRVCSVRVASLCQGDAQPDDRSSIGVCSRRSPMEQVGGVTS